MSRTITASNLLLYPLVNRWALRALVFTMLLASLLVSLLVTSDAKAYLPSSRTIANRVVKNHGRGYYAIEQEVQIRTASEPVILRERWVVENGENMRLTVASPKSAQEAVRFDAIYRGGKNI